jgi:hypothetical protein
MNEKGVIITGLVIFLVALTFPVWLAVGGAKSGAPPDHVLPESGGRCVLDTPYMRDAHMDLLNEWRDEVVRDGDRFFTAEDGYHLPPGKERLEKSLTRTCLDCHGNKVEFCDRCHDYSSVDPYCWDCHVVPGGE